MTAKKKHARMGRPPMPAAERSAHILSIRLLPRDIAMLDELVADCGRTKAEVVRTAIAGLFVSKAARARLREGPDG